MKVLILGGAGMIGQKLAKSILTTARLGRYQIADLILLDQTTPTVPALDNASAINVQCGQFDITSADDIAAAVRERPDIIVQLAAVVSGEAEANFEKGYQVNFDGMRTLLEEIRLAGEAYKPKIIFSSSIAVFGGGLPDVVPDDHVTAPQNSYGTQKAICELMLHDYSRKGYVDGVSIRLPTIIIRPGLPNKAASSFYSGILREPLNGVEAILPVNKRVRHWFASPRAAVNYFHHAVNLDSAAVDSLVAINLPGISATVQELIDALQRVAGDEAVALIKEVPDPQVEAIVRPWAKAFDGANARRLGFKPDENLDAIVKVYIEDELDSV